MSAWQNFWQRYERQHRLATVLTAILFSWQLVHLYWLTTAVVIPRLFGLSLFSPGPAFEFLLIIVDYTEIPALIGASLFYGHQLQKKFSVKPVLFLLLINSQWLHLFWITDEFVLERFAGSAISLPLWLAWLAISIDYFELPVIADTMRHAIRSLRRKAVVTT